MADVSERDREAVYEFFNVTPAPPVYDLAALDDYYPATKLAALLARTRAERLSTDLEYIVELEQERDAVRDRIAALERERDAAQEAWWKVKQFRDEIAPDLCGGTDFWDSHTPAEIGAKAQQIRDEIIDAICSTVREQRDAAKLAGVRAGIEAAAQGCDCAYAKERIRALDAGRIAEGHDGE